MKKIKKLTDLEWNWKIYQEKNPILPFIKATQIKEEGVIVVTKKGLRKAFQGDFIIQTLDGLEPCKREIFEEVYREVGGK